MRQLKTFGVVLLLAMTLAQSKAEAVYWYPVSFECTDENWRQAVSELGYWAALVWWYGNGCFMGDK